MAQSSASVWDLAGDVRQETTNATPAQKKKKVRKKTPKENGPNICVRFWRFLLRKIKSMAQEFRALSKRKKVLRVFVCVTIFSLFLLVLGIGGVFTYWQYSTRNDDLFLDLNQIPYNSETILYYTDAQTGELHEYAVLQNTQDKEYVSGDLMPQNLKDAFVAVEDQDFYEHNGVDITRTIYVTINELKYILTGSFIGGDDGLRQGASTINQQLVKNLLRDDEDSGIDGYLRKLREIYRAWVMDAEFTKDEILSAYLNTISFTDNTAGVQAESQKLFGKSVEELSLAECASLAAITRSPASYNPVTNPERHIERRNYVLDQMLAEGYISNEEHSEAVATPLNLTGPGTSVRETEVTSYFTDAVIDELITQLVEERDLTRGQASHLLYNGGLRIHTTVVPQLQEAMEYELENEVSYPRPFHTVQGPLTDENGEVLLDENGNEIVGDVEEYAQAAMISLTYDGGIAAVVGGLGEKEISRGFNRGTSAVRQVGSTMKGIAPYPLGIEDGDIHWSSGFLDEAVAEVENEETGEMEPWPANVDRVYSGEEILVPEAFARSVNTVAVRVGEEVGTWRMYNFVTNDLGIETFVSDDRDLGPLVLGSSTYGITPLDMARSYAMFGNGGYVPQAHSYTLVTKGTGEPILNTNTQLHSAISADTAYIMNRLLSEVMQGVGTAFGRSVPGEMDSVGKTGTTSDNRDHWFIGLTPYYVTASWYGYDDNTPLEVNNSAHPPTLAWRNVMSEAQSGLPYREFPANTSVQEISYCTESGAMAGVSCPSATGYYTQNNLPSAHCPVHG